MSKTGDWFAQRLGVAPQRQAQPPQQYAAPPPQQYPPPQQFQQPQPQYQQPEVTGQQILDAVRAKTAPLGSFVQAMNLWKGGKATATEKELCPNCGGPHYYSRKGLGGVRGMAPAPLCADCGYNGGLFDQYAATHDATAEGEQ